MLTFAKGLIYSFLSLNVFFNNLMVPNYFCLALSHVRLLNPSLVFQNSCQDFSYSNLHYCSGRSAPSVLIS